MLQRLLMGVAMGGSAVAIIYSPWGKQSGAHFNPAVTVGLWAGRRFEAAGVLRGTRGEVQVAQGAFLPVGNPNRPSRSSSQIQEAQHLKLFAGGVT